MAAKITGVELASASIGGSPPRSRGEVAARAPDASNLSSEVSVTSTAARLSELEQSLQSLPAVDASRVSGLQTAVASGQYSVDPQSVASGLIGTEQALSALHGEGH